MLACSSAMQKHACQKFSLKVGTIFEDSPLGLEKWLPVMWMLANCKNGVSSWEIHRAVGVTQKTAWFMLQRARLAMQDTETGGKLGGEVEVDETFIGGKARNMHKEKRAEEDQRNGRERQDRGHGSSLERGGQGRSTVVAQQTKENPCKPCTQVTLSGSASLHRCPDIVRRTRRSFSMKWLTTR